jgi:uncharacterized protein (UPF0264 family)
MQLLVSVANVSEARSALAGGADVIDAKDPRRGALGPVCASTLVELVHAVGTRRPVSAALGDAEPVAAVERAAYAAAAVGVTFVKVGCRGVREATAGRLAAAARRGAGPTTRVVLVAYADWRRARSIAPERLARLAAEHGAWGVLLDTAFKEEGLFGQLGPDAVQQWVGAAHAAGLCAALAGGLRGSDFATAQRAGADLVGVRGAACIGGREGRVSRARVARLRALARTPVPAVALV